MGLHVGMSAAGGIGVGLHVGVSAIGAVLMIRIESGLLPSNTK